MIKLNAKHHTVSDWDITAGVIKVLDTVQKVSPPSSLKLGFQAPPPTIGNILCRIAATQCIAQGEVRTWNRQNYETNVRSMLFRNQSALGTPTILNTYLWSWIWSTASLARYIAGVGVTIGNVSITGWVNNQWNHVRCVYWNGLNELGNPALVTQFFLEIAGAWVQQGATLYDTANQWKDSATNRSGLSATVSGYNLWFDDTEIWGPA